MHFRYKYACLSLLTCCTGVLFADLEDHLRKISDKTDGHTIRNIDFIYMINLDQRPEKWKLSNDQLNPFGIYPYRFSAVNGWELSLETINDVGLKFSPEMEGGFWGTSYLLDGGFKPHHELIQNYGQTYFCHCMARGTIGICLSHISILQDAYNLGYETIWVMEDDIEIIRDPRTLSDLIDRLDEAVGNGNWDILFTDRDTKRPDGSYATFCGPMKRPDFALNTNDHWMNRAVNSEFRQIGGRYGAYSMIIRKCGINKLIKYFYARQIFGPIDQEYGLPPNMRLYTVLNDVVSTLPKAASDNGGANYLKNL